METASLNSTTTNARVKFHNWPLWKRVDHQKFLYQRGKCQQKHFDSSLVNPYENVIPFFCFSVNHRRKALCNLPYLTLSFRHFKTASRGELSGSSETIVSALRWLWFVYCITTESAAENQFCQALFVLCRGSTLSKSTYFPDRGTNSCLNLFWAINL